MVTNWCARVPRLDMMRDRILEGSFRFFFLTARFCFFTSLLVFIYVFLLVLFIKFEPDAPPPPIWWKAFMVFTRNCF